jgi:hypothetical protein
MKKIFVAVPTVGTIVDSQAHFLRKAEKLYKDEIEFVYPDKCVRRIFHDYARNAMVEEFLETDCDAMWFLDSDITPPVHVFDLVTQHWDKWKLAGAPYPVFMQPPGYDGPQVVFTVYKGSSEQGLHPSRIPDSGTDFVDGIATGCLFIKREVFDALERPYFEFKYRQEDRHITEGEDIGFCKKVLAKGFKFFVDYSMVCGHTKTVDLLDVNNYAITFANQSIQNYDAQVRGTVEALKAQLQEVFRQRKERDSLAPGPTGTLWRPR